MKTKDAEDKWCPFAITTDLPEGIYKKLQNRLTPIVGPPFYAIDNVPIKTKCVTTKCMAWNSEGETEGYCGMVHGLKA